MFEEHCTQSKSINKVHWKKKNPSLILFHASSAEKNLFMNKSDRNSTINMYQKCLNQARVEVFTVCMCSDLLLYVLCIVLCSPCDEDCISGGCELFSIVSWVHHVFLSCDFRLHFHRQHYTLHPDVIHTVRATTQRVTEPHRKKKNPYKSFISPQQNGKHKYSANQNIIYNLFAFPLKEHEGITGS